MKKDVKPNKLFWGRDRSGESKSATAMARVGNEGKKGSAFKVERADFRKGKRNKRATWAMKKLAQKAGA